MKAAEYLKEVKNEMTHVSFPSKKQAMLYTVLVILFSLAVAVALGFFDFLFKAGLEQILKF